MNYKFKCEKIGDELTADRNADGRQSLCKVRIACQQTDHLLAHNTSGPRMRPCGTP